MGTGPPAPLSRRAGAAPLRVPRPVRRRRRQPPRAGRRLRISPRRQGGSARPQRSAAGCRRRLPRDDRARGRTGRRSPPATRRSSSSTRSTPAASTGRGRRRAGGGGPGETARPRVGRPAKLTEREVDVLRLIARGHANKQVAADARHLAQDGGAPHRAHLRQGRGHHPGRGDAVRHGARPAVALTGVGHGANTRLSAGGDGLTIPVRNPATRRPPCRPSTSTTPPSTTSAADRGRRCCSCTACAVTPRCGPTRPAGSRTATPACATTAAVTPAAVVAGPRSATSQHADDAAALIEALGLAPCLIVGSSGGAAIAVDVALRHGHLLRGAVLSEPPLFSLDPDAGQALMGELRPRLEQRWPPAARAPRSTRSSR